MTHQQARLTRRTALSTIAAVGATALAGCSGGDGDSGSGTDDSTVVTNIEVVEQEEPTTRLVLAVDLAEDHGIDELALQDSEGSVVTDGGVDPAQTRVELSLAQATLTPEPYEVIGYDGETVVEQTEWTPETGVSIAGASVGSANQNLILELEPTGSIPLSLADAYITEGFPVENGEDRAGEPIALIEIDPYRNDNPITITGEAGVLLQPPNGSCDGSDQQLTGTIEFDEHEPINFEADLSMGTERDVGVSGDSCSETTVESIREL